MDAYDEVNEFRFQSGDETLVELAKECDLIRKNETINRDALDDVLVEIADTIMGFDGLNFVKSKYWEMENDDAIDLAYSIYVRLVRDLPDDRKLFCTYLDDSLYLDHQNF